MPDPLRDPLVDPLLDGDPDSHPGADPGPDAGADPGADPGSERERGGRNVAAFLAATAGRRGTVGAVRGGTLVAGPIAFPNGFVNAAVRTDQTVPVAAFLDDAQAFFAEHERAFVLWALGSDQELLTEAERRGAVRQGEATPAMTIAAPIPQPLRGPSTLTISAVATDEEGEVFADLAERGYGIPGLGWLLTNHDTFRAPGTSWVIVSDGLQPLGVACGFGIGDVGGVYYVGTPAEHRGRGVAALATAFVTNEQFARGARSVVLQASAMGFGIYERLGFAVYDTYEQLAFPDA